MQKLLAAILFVIAVPTVAQACEYIQVCDFNQDGSQTCQWVLSCDCQRPDHEDNLVYGFSDGSAITRRRVWSECDTLLMCARATVNCPPSGPCMASNAPTVLPCP